MLDEADELYALPLEEFTAARDALAKRLRAEKRRDDADAVKALKRPSVAAGAINRAVREHGADELLAAGEELRAAHEALLEGSGDAAAVRAATERERTAVRELAQLALGDGASAATEEKVRATLHAASVDDDVRERLAAGRLERDAEAGVDPMALMAAAGGKAGTKASSGGKTASSGEKKASSGEKKASSGAKTASSGTKKASSGRGQAGPSEAELRRTRAAERAQEQAERAVAAQREAEEVAERARAALAEAEEAARKARAVVEDLEGHERQARRAVKEAEADAERRRTEARRAVKAAEARA